MKHLDLFSGIGGFALATEMVWDNVEHVFCDSEPFSQAVLNKHWPEAKIYEDIKTLKGKEIGKIDLITGGFPCQPFSQAGKQKGTSDDRDLWPEMFRVIQETKPRWIIGENVAGFVNMELERTIVNLESEGYEVEALIIPAVAINAPHRRDRVWIIGRRNTNVEYSFTNSSGSRHRGRTNQKRRIQQPIMVKGEQKRGSLWNQNKGRTTGNWFKIATQLCRMDDGVPARLDKTPRIKALGNAIVPQIATEIMKIIKKIDERQNNRQTRR